MKGIIITNIPAAPQECLDRLSNALTEKLTHMVESKIGKKNITCCFSLNLLSAFKEKGIAVIVFDQHTFTSKEVKHNLVLKIDPIIKAHFRDEISVGFEFIGWPDIFGNSQDEIFTQKEEKE